MSEVETAEAAEAKVKFYEALAAFIVVWGSLPITILAKTFVLSKMWTWFITPEYGIEAPGLAMLAGLSIMVSYATMQRQRPKDTDTELWFVVYQAFLYGVAAPSIMLLIAYVIHLFV